MEPSILFAEFILGMCVVHLAGMASEHVAKWWAKSSQRSASGDLAKKTTRSDWYCFFNCSDLYGKEPRKNRSQTVKPTEKVRPSRDQRPTLRV